MEFLIIALVLAAALAVLAWTAHRRRLRRAGEARAATLRLAEALRRAAAPAPELLDAVGDYASYERAVFAEVRAAAADAGRAETTDDVFAAHDRLLAAFGDLFAIVEVYPDLTADEATAARIRVVEDALESAARRRAELAAVLTP